MKVARVVHLASDDGWGGAERVLSILLPALAKRDELDLEVVLLNEGKLGADLRRGGTRVRVVDERALAPRALLTNLRSAIAGADVVHTHRYKEIALASLAKRSAQRLIATIHGLEPRNQMSLAQAAKIWGALWLARLRGATFVTVSDELRLRMCRGLLTPNVRQIPNPLAPSTARNPAPIDIRQRFGWEATRRLVGFAGRLEPVKGPDLLLEAAELLNVGIAIAFLGSGSLDGELKRRCEERGLSSRIGFLGEVPDARAYLGQFDALAVPSRHEGIPMIVLEAAEAGLPVAAFDVGGLKELLTDPNAMRLVSQGDTRALAAALTTLIETSSSATAAQRWGTALATRFSLDSITSDYARLYTGDPTPSVRTRRSDPTPRNRAGLDEPP